MSIKKMTLLCTLVALGIVLNQIENVIFPWTILPIPGAKLGLANVVFLVMLPLAGFKYSLSASLLRVLMVAVISGTLATIIFPLSFGGAFLSICLMQIFYYLFRERIGFVGLSIVGAVGHNLGQLFVLVLIPTIFPGWSAFWCFFLPMLLLLALPAGLITGWIAQKIYPTLKREWEKI